MYAMNVRRRTTIAALLLVFCVAPGLRAQDAISLLPPETVGYLVVNDLAKTSDKIEQVAKQLQVPAPSPLAFFKAAAGIQKGFDEKGTVVVAFVSSGEDIEEGYPIAILPVTDYKAFVGQFGAQDPDEQIVEVPVADEQVLIGKKGAYAVFAEPERKAELKKLLESDAKPSAELQAIKSWLTKNNLAGVITMHGIQLATARASKELKKVQGEFGGENLPLDDDALSQVRQAFQMYAMILEFTGQEMTAGGVGVWISDEGDIHLTSRALFTLDGATTKALAGVKPSEVDPLRGIPAGPYFIAGGGNVGGLMSDALVKWSVNLIKSNPSIYGFKKLTDAEAEKLAAASAGMSKSVEWMSLRMGPGKGDEPLYGAMVMAYGVTDAKTYVKEYRQSLDAWNEIANKPENEGAMKWEVKDIDVDGSAGLEFTLDFSALAGAQGPAEMKQMFEKMFGEGGKMRIYLAPADDKTLFATYSSKDKLAEVIKSFKQGATGLSKDVNLGKTAAKLPTDATMVGYMSPTGTIALVNRAIQLFAGPVFSLPAFPETPPVGTSISLSKSGIETDCVLPSDTLKACVRYAMTLEKAFGGGF
jgi:hypothetical protein